MSNLYLEHHGIKGMKWGVRRYQNPDGSLTSAGHRRYLKNKKIIDKEVAYQNNRISGFKRTAKAYRSSAEEIRKSGYSELRKNGADDKTAREAVRLVSSKRDTEALWNEHLAKHYSDYNKRISQIDVSTMTRIQVHKMIQEEGNKTVSEINRTWEEPTSTKEYADAVNGKKKG